MATRTNLATNPALKVNSTGWYGYTGAARVTGLTGMPRTTGFSNPAGGGAVTPQATVTAGQTATLSVYIKPQASGTVTYGIDWRSSTTGYLSSTTAQTLAVTAGNVYRIQVSGTVVTNANRALLTVLFPAGTLVITAFLAEQAAGPAQPYFDGDSTGEVSGWVAAWTGTSGNSTSTLTFSDVSALVPFAAQTMTGLGVLRTTGTGLVSFGPMTIFTGLIVTASYDPRRGRVRVFGSGWPPAAVRTVTYHRQVGTSRWTEVRGGRVPVTGGEFARIVDDYEYTASAAMEYRVVGLSSPENTTDVVVQEKIITVDLTAVRDTWLKFIASPHRNLPIQLVGWSEIERPARLALYEVKGRRDPIAVTDVHGARRVTIELRTTTTADGDALDEALSAGFPALLHLPSGIALSSMYCVVGDYQWSRPARRSLIRRWSVQITEVSPPPPSIVGVGRTWQTILDQYASWGELLDTFGTWQEVVD